MCLNVINLRFQPEVKDLPALPGSEGAKYNQQDIITISYGLLTRD